MDEPPLQEIQSSGLWDLVKVVSEGVSLLDAESAGWIVSGSCSRLCFPHPGVALRFLPVSRMACLRTSFLTAAFLKLPRSLEVTKANFLSCGGMVGVLMGYIWKWGEW